MCESVQYWRKKWFYIRDAKVDGQDFGLAPFESSQEIILKRSWKNHILEAEVEEVEELYRRVEALQMVAGKEVNGVDIIHTFPKRRVQPLQARAHPMFLYTGCHDPTRVPAKELSKGDLDRVLRPLLKYKSNEDLPGKSRTPPFSASRPVPQV